MGDFSSFASAFASAGAGDGAFGSRAASPPRPSRVVGFASSAERAASAGPEACAMAERQASLGGLGALLRARSLAAEPEPPRGPRLSITTTRSLRVGAGQRARRGPAAPRIEEHAAEHHGSDELGSTAPSRPAAPMARAASGNIDILPSARLGKAQTAPDGLPDSLVMAAIALGAGGSGSHSRSPTAACPPAACPQAAGAAAPPAGQPQLGPARSGSGESATSAAATNSTSTSGWPPMPVTPAFAAVRSGSREQQEQQQQRGGGPQRQGSSSGSYRELFNAQAEAAMAQAQVNGLQEALRRRSDEVEQLQAALVRMTLERDTIAAQHRQSEAAHAHAMQRSQSDVPASVFSSSAFYAASECAVAGNGGAAAAVAYVAAPPAAAGPLRLQASGRGRSALHTSSRGSGAAGGGQQPRGPSHLRPADPAEELPAATMVSAFASHALPFSF